MNNNEFLEGEEEVKLLQKLLKRIERLETIIENTNGINICLKCLNIKTVCDLCKGKKCFTCEQSFVHSFRDSVICQDCRDYRCRYNH